MINKRIYVDEIRDSTIAQLLKDIDNIRNELLRLQALQGITTITEFPILDRLKGKTTWIRKALKEDIYYD